METLKIKNATEQGYLEAEEGDGVDISGRMQYHRGTVQKGMCQTLNTMGTDGGVVIKQNGGGSKMNQLRIRKLTPLECMRLMGGTDEMYYALRDIAELSDSQIYHICGDGLIPQIVEMIVRQMKG